MRYFKTISTKLVGVILVGGLLASCASIVDGGKTRPVSINSATTGQEFIIKNKAGKTVHRGTTPAIVNLNRSGSGYFEKEQYTIQLTDGSGVASVKSSASGWYIAGNIVFGGLIGWLIVDPATGAMYNLKPDTVNLN